MHAHRAAARSRTLGRMANITRTGSPAAAASGTAVALVSARPRLLLSVAVGLLAGTTAVAGRHRRAAAAAGRRLIVAWNAGAWLYLALAGWMMVAATPSQIGRRARREDEGARTILALVVAAALCSLGAIVAELAARATARQRAHHARRAGGGHHRVVLGLHAGDVRAALRPRLLPRASTASRPGWPFPTPSEPDYLDFLYFAVVIGTSGQTADIAFASRAMRRVGMVHCVLAFVFNTSPVGLMIIAASGLDLSAQPRTSGQTVEASGRPAGRCACRCSAEVALRPAAGRRQTRAAGRRRRAPARPISLAPASPASIACATTRRQAGCAPGCRLQVRASIIGAAVGMGLGDAVEELRAG